jgi:hypothetical protein
MIEQLENSAPLSQVWFVHDYIQLQFQERSVTVMNTPKLRLSSGVILERKDEGFCDCLVSQIEQSIQDSQLRDNEEFLIRFASGVELIIPLTEEAANGPEAVELPGAVIVFNT